MTIKRWVLNCVPQGLNMFSFSDSSVRTDVFLTQFDVRYLSCLFLFLLVCTSGCIGFSC
jgi:hypothetical protein